MPSVTYDASNCPCCGCTKCCGIDPIPETLNAAVSWNSANPVSCCFGVTTDVTLTWNNEECRWEGCATVGTCGEMICIRYYCDDGSPFSFHLEFDYCTGVFEELEGVTTCDPLEGSYAGGAATDCCPHSPGITVFVTE